MRQAIAAFLISILGFSVASAEFGDYIEHTVVDEALHVRTDMGTLVITAVDDAALEVHYREDGVTQLPSFAIAATQSSIAAEVSDSDEVVTIAVDGLVAIVHKSPVRIDFQRDGQPLLAEQPGYFLNESDRGFHFELEADEKILGGGQRVLGMDRRGHRLPLYNKADYGYTSYSEQMYYSVPAIMSSDKYLLVFDNSASGWLDIGKTETDTLSFEAVGGRTAYIVVAGDSYPELIKNYTDVTGRQPLPPRWALGNFASRFGYRSETEARAVVSQFAAEDIPLDAIILDLFWYGPDIKGHVGNLDWDRDTFPTAEDMIAEFSEQGVKTIALTQPFVLKSSKRWQDAVDNQVLAKHADGSPYRFDFYFGNTGLIDIFDENARDWFWQANKQLFDQGMAGTWGDLGEPEVHPDDILHWLSDEQMWASGAEVHNAYGHRWAQMIYERQTNEYPDVRPLLLMRSGFAGTQRYGIVPWTGDVSRSWDGLKPQIELTLQMGLVGLAYTHSDLGGFAAGEEFDKEMYIRWLQYGVFQPVYRPHGQDHIASEPVFHDRQTRRITGEFIKLRYRLLPYNYTLAWENSTTGMPLMRPLFFEDERNPALIETKDAFLWGDAFLVAPITDPDVEAQTVDLPPGVWFDFWDDTRYQGRQSVEIPVSLESIPVLVRAGSFVPMVEPVQTSRDYSSEALTLHYYADKSVHHARGQMYEDDGQSAGSLAAGNYELLEFSASQVANSLTIELQRSGGEYPSRPAQRELTLVVHNWTSKIDEVRIGEQSIPISLRLPKQGPGATYSGRKNELTIRFDWDHSDQRLTVNPTAETLGKPVVYQVFTRLFGNQNTNNKPWGTIEENGVGKFEDITDTALQSIRDLGTTHVWYTGVPHHAVIRDYSLHGISNDDPDVVKGRAGSPYAIKDYYNVNPDLAIDVDRRLQEFDALIDRTHANGMQVVIDIVPNHVARAYLSTSKPPGVQDFGASDDTRLAWSRDNNFYYVVDEDFAVPDSYVPLGGEAHPLADGEFDESPAKWTGNGARTARPATDDWFETVKINFGVRPDGTVAFDRLPEAARNWTDAQHAEFWSGRSVPDSWIKFRDIAHFWMDRGVDGFRYDMAQMVPVEFWSFLNSSLKVRNPDAFLLSEIYVPDRYRDYIEFGRMDYLYDKVGFYDTLRAIMVNESPAQMLITAQQDVLDIDAHMLHFLENHDEQRIASDAFAGDPEIGKPAMVASTLIGGGPTMLYFGQEVGVSGDGDAGFGTSSRTTIFDYWGVPAHQRWMNGGRFDGGALSDQERSLREFYQSLLSYSANAPVLRGNYAPLSSGLDRVLAFSRWTDTEQLIVLSNFDAAERVELTLEIPAELVAEQQLADGRYALDEQLADAYRAELVIDNGVGTVRTSLEPLQSRVLRVGEALFKPADEQVFINDWQDSGVAGTLVYWQDTPSDYLPDDRHVVVWLPPEYDTNPDQRYRVIYMSDGENLFDPRIASWGVDWGIDEAMLAAADEIEPAIVVGTWSTPHRAEDYSPWHDAPNYAQFLINELMPRVNAEFRTLTGPDNTFAMGSSMGGLLAYYLVTNHVNEFSACGCVSTAFALSPAYMSRNAQGDSEMYILKDIAAGQTVPPTSRFFFDYGTETLDATYEDDHAPVRDWLLKQDRVEGEDFKMQKYHGADHSERAWRARVRDQLIWLLGNQ